MKDNNAGEKLFKLVYRNNKEKFALIESGENPTITTGLIVEAHDKILAIFKLSFIQ